MLLGTLVYSSPAQIPLILGIAITCIIGHFLGYSYEEIEDSMIETNKMGLQANFYYVNCRLFDWFLDSRWGRSRHDILWIKIIYT